MNFKLKDEIYTILKWLTLVFLPALASFIGVVLIALNKPSEPYLTILNGFTAFLGALIGISSINYNRDK